MLSPSPYCKKYFHMKINIYLKHERNIEDGFHPLKKFSEKKNNFSSHIFSIILYTQGNFY